MVFKLGKVCIGKDNKYECRYVPHSPNSLNSRHWSYRAKWKRAWEDEVLFTYLQHAKNATGGKGDTKKTPLEVRVGLFTISPMDLDNSYASTKPILDGLIKAGAIPDDSPESISLSLSVKKVSRVEEQCVEISII